MNAKKNHRNITVIALVLVLVSGAFLTEAVQSSTLNAPLALETPTDIGLSSTTVAENEPSGTVVGTLSTVDADVGDSFTYTLVTGDGDDDNTSFSIVGDELWTGAFFNFEVKNSYSVRIRSTDMDTLFVEKVFTISVTNVVENAPTDISLAPTEVPENEPIGTMVGTLTTTDPDEGDSFTYELVAGTGDTDNGSFSIVGNELRTAESFNHETKDSYSIRISTTDADEQEYSDSFTITVTDVNENPTDVFLDNNTVPENESSGATVGTFTTEDPDVGDSFTYSLVSGTGDTDNGSFSIVGDELRTGASFNFEVKNSYSVRIRSTDMDALFVEKAFTVSVTNVVENAPTDISLDSEEVPENEPIGTMVGTFHTTDTDEGDSFTYELVAGTGDTDNGSFNIVGDELRTAASFNHETKDTYNIRVRSTDADGLSVEAAFTIDVTDVDDGPTDISLDPVEVPENEPIGTVVGTLSTTDPTVGDTFTYELVSGVGDDDNSSFNIAGSSLRTAASFDYETKSSYSIRISSTDGDEEYQESFTITVTDVNENPTDIGLSSASVAENQPAGTVVGTFSTTDPDAGDTFTYELVEGDGDADNASFEIAGGTLKTKAVFDRETKSTYTIRVQTSDSGSLTLPKQLTITIANVNEAPVAVADLNYQMRQGEIMNLAKALDGVLANDVDVDHDVLYAVLVTPPEQIESEDDFLLRPDGTFYYKPDPDYVSRSTDPKPYDSFTYYVTDRESGGLTSNTVEVRIEVLDANSPTVAWVLPITNDEDTFFVDTENVLLQAEATDNVAVRRVRFYRWKPDETDPLKGRFIDIASVDTKPYQTILDVSTLDLQYNQVFVEAYDNMGNKSQRQRILMYRTSQVLFPYQLFMPGVLHTRAVSVP